MMFKPWFLLCLLVLMPALAAQDGPRCTKCRREGVVPCRQHKKKDCALESNAQWCSFVADCETCSGTGFIDCVKCESPTAEALLNAKVKAQAEYAKNVARVTEEMDRDLRAVVSEHFTIICEIDKAKVGKINFDGHHLIHLYIDRLERLYDDYTETLGVADVELPTRCLVMIWTYAQDQKTASGRFCGQTALRGVKFLGNNPVYSVNGSKSIFNSEEELARNVIHNTTHLLLALQSPPIWLGRNKGGWADAGLAHWFEDRYYGVCDNYCYQEVFTSTSLSLFKWRPRMRNLIVKGKAPSLPAVMKENTEGLSNDMHIVAFSIVDFMIAQDGAKAGEVFTKMRQKVSTRDAIQQVFGWGILELQGLWSEWVLGTYPAR